MTSVSAFSTDDSVTHVWSAVSVGEKESLRRRRLLHVPCKEASRLANSTPRPNYKCLSQLQRYNTRLSVFSESPRSIRTPQTCLKFSKGLSEESTLSASIRELTKLSHLALRKPYWPATAKYVAGLHRLLIGDIA